MCWGNTLFKMLLAFMVVTLSVPRISWGALASKEYVNQIVNSIQKTTEITSGSTDSELPTAHAVWQLHATVSGEISNHVADKANPHSVTAAQVGLASVKNIDTTNASNITSGTLATSRLSVGTTAGTVAAGDDVRFNAVPTSQPAGTPPTGMVWVWFEK